MTIRLDIPLTEQAKALREDTFAFCQLCGDEKEDICDIRIWEEGIQVGKEWQRTGKFVVVGRQCCQRYIDDSEICYWMIQWGKGKPGYFVLTCGNCSFRNGFTCNHPDLTKNGGSGLEVKISDPFDGMVVHLNPGGYMDFKVYSGCEGNPESDCY